MSDAARGAVLVTGGAGYIGSHTVLELVAAGRRVVVLDDLSTGQADRLPAGAPLVIGSSADPPLVEALCREHGVTAAVHFAASIVAPESIARPLAYYRNNLAGMVGLLEGCVAGGVRTVLFSSSAAVYAPALRAALAEDAPLGPSTPYGWSKLMAEQVLEDVARAHGLRWCALRYFNVAGAEPGGRILPRPASLTHLIGVACEVALGRRPALPVHGVDWPTRDGSCERDFIHVCDLAEAHRAALDALEAGGESGRLNCGYGRAVSVLEVAGRLGVLVGAPLALEIAPRRPGDLASVVADSARLRERLGWTPRRDDLDLILGSALEAARRMPRET